MRVGVDVGGTFTDAVLLGEGRSWTAKTPTTPGDQAQGVLEAIRLVLEQAGAEHADVESFRHGMTIGTNALLERRGAETALVATAGFTDLLEIARQRRVHLYRLCADRPAPLVRPEMRVGVRERIGPDGVITELTGAEVDRVVAEIDGLGAEAVAICLLFSFRGASHEGRIAEALRERLPHLHVSASSEVLPRFREYERCSTTVADAYLAPLLATYLEGLGRSCRELGLPEPELMQSSGGIATLERARLGGAWSVLSGPAGGAVGAGIRADGADAAKALGFDMGGTSCDVCLIEDGAVHRGPGGEIAGRPLSLPMVDVHTVGAGGGSVGWRDPGGALRVGPRSAGADPGPACYGLGGTEPTVTDANLLLGYLGAGASLAGVELDPDAARAAIAGLASELDLGVEETAAGIVRIANLEMVGALRVVSVERGVDPRDHTLVSFGGAGGLHAAAIARDLGMRRILCPAQAGVLSAFGLIASEERRDLARTVLLDEAAIADGRLAAVAEALKDELADERTAEAEVVFEVRYLGQAFELDVQPARGIDGLRDAFEVEHERRYGYRDPDAEIEIVGIRAAALGNRPQLPPDSGEDPRVERSSRLARFGDEELESVVLSGGVPAGEELQGPAVIELPETTLLVPPGATVRGTGESGEIEILLGESGG
jgi:N-methylhydantoinase A